MRANFLPTLFLFALLGRAVTPLGAAPALGVGEQLTYRVGWGIFFGAGEIKISADEAATEKGHLQMQVTTTTKTRGLARVLFPFDAQAEAMFDIHTGQIVSSHETSKSSTKETNTRVMFDYGQAVANYINEMDPTKSAALPMPAGNPADLIVSLVQTRAWNLQPGEQRDALVIFDGEFYELTIHAVRFEEIYTPLGTFKTLVLEPRMEKTEPKGMFKRGSGVRVWITQDDRRLPVKFQVEFKFGSGVATLTHYQPPTGETAAVAVADEKNPHP